MKTYNKLVRDKIPEIIEADGRTPLWRTLKKAEYKKALCEKLVEEVKEVNKAKEKKELMKEIGDVEEVIQALIETFNLERKGITKLRNKRKRERGGFSKQIWLEGVK